MPLPKYFTPHRYPCWFTSQKTECAYRKGKMSVAQNHYRELQCEINNRLAANPDKKPSKEWKQYLDECKQRFKEK